MIGVSGPPCTDAHRSSSKRAVAATASVSVAVARRGGEPCLELTTSWRISSRAPSGLVGRPLRARTRARRKSRSTSC